MLETPRLLLRDWRAADVAPFAALYADPEVMRYFPALLSAAETEAMLERNRLHFARHGFGFWAAEAKETGELAGFIGLGIPSFEAHFTPCVEIRWRLAPRFWNRGLATEGAAALLGWAAEVLRLEEVVAFTAVENRASRRVMEKLGMTRDEADDFDHPRVPAGHPLQRHVLYRWRPR
ncbi:MAG: GNAT family N-acetyltransferase [Acidobacteria bacterium]|nr:GNAT family N-acetyltransferase [Acidobacteriota bacterium]